MGRAEQVIKKVGNKFKNVIQKVVAGTGDLASDLEHKVIKGATKVITKVGQAIHHVTVDVENKFAKSERKLKNSVKAATHHVLQKVAQGAKGAEQAVKDEAESKLAVVIAKVAHTMQEVHHVVTKGKQAVQKIEDAPKEIKEKFEKDKHHVEEAIKGFINKDTGKVEKKLHELAQKTSGFLHIHPHKHHHHRRKSHGHHGGLKRLIHKIHI